MNEFSYPKPLFYGIGEFLASDKFEGLEIGTVTSTLFNGVIRVTVEALNDDCEDVTVVAYFNHFGDLVQQGN